MPDTGAIYPGTVATVAIGGSFDVDWVNPDNVKADDGNYATVSTTIALNVVDSYILKCTNFGFSIPDGVTVTGIKVEVQKKCNFNITNKNAVDDNPYIKLIKGGTIQGIDHSNSNVYATSDEIIIYGSSTDLWGLTLSSSDINSSDFGFSMATYVVNEVDADIVTASIDFIRMTVYYTGDVVKNLSDSITVSDSAGKTLTKSISDSVLSSDNSIKGITKSVSDSVSSSDENIKLFTKSNSDSAVISETRISEIEKELNDTANTNDSVAKTIVLNKNDSVNSNDQSIKTIGKSLSDSATISDLFTKVFSFIRSLADSVSVIDIKTISQIVVRVVYPFKKVSGLFTKKNLFSKNYKYTKINKITKNNLISRKN